MLNFSHKGIADIQNLNQGFNHLAISVTYDQLGDSLAMLQDLLNIIINDIVVIASCVINYTPFPAMNTASYCFQ